MVSADITDDTDTFTKMDPFVKVEFQGGETKQTKALQSAGKNPVWNEKLTFDVKTINQASSTIRVSLWDEDIKFHDEIGADLFSFLFFHAMQGTDVKYILYNKKNDSVGTLIIKA